MTRAVKSIFFVLTLSAVAACCQRNMDQEKKADLFWYTTGNGRFQSDTFAIEKIHKIHGDDTLIGIMDFVYKNEGHRISVFDVGRMHVDGRVISFNLDELGIIFSKTGVWQNYGRLRSNNDSINDLIDHCMEVMVFEAVDYDLETNTEKLIKQYNMSRRN